MQQSFEYLVCQSQAGKITFVNEEFAGTFRGDAEIPEIQQQMYDSCPSFYEHLTKLGQDGWELVCGYNIVNERAQYEKLIFKRPK